MRTLVYAAACVVLAVPSLFGWGVGVPCYLIGMALVFLAVLDGRRLAGPLARPGYAWLAATVAWWWIGDAVWLLPGAAPAAGPVPMIAWLAASTCLIISVLAFLRRGAALEHRRAALLDAGVICLALAMAVWTFLPPRNDARSTTLTDLAALAFTGLDVLLAGAWVALVLTPRRPNRATILIGATVLRVPLLHLIQLLFPTLIPPNVMLALVLVLNSLIGLAALDPSRDGPARAPRRRVPGVFAQWRVLALCFGLITMVISSALPTPSQGASALGRAGLGVLIVVLVSLRFAGLIAERDRAHAELLHRARHDELTGLPNRVALSEEFGHLGEPSRVDRRLTLFYVDLNGFKQINDAHGHSAGDMVLTTVGERLRGTVRGHDLVVRMGGDEFAVLAVNLPEEQAHRRAEQMALAVGEPITLPSGASVTVGASVGRSQTTLPSGQSTTVAALAELLGHADESMYRAKGRRTGVRE